MTNESESFDELSAAPQRKAADQARRRCLRRRNTAPRDWSLEPTSTRWVREPPKRRRTSTAAGANFSPATRTSRKLRII
jgi:hypothetical protein